jgi:hypothetical protein
MVAETHHFLQELSEKSVYDSWELLLYLVAALSRSAAVHFIPSS